MVKYFKDKLFILSQVYSKKTGLDLVYFVKNGFWMMLRQAADILIGTILFAIFARLATKEIFGFYQFVLSVFAVVGILSIPGLNTAVLRDVSRGNDGDYVPAVKKSFIWSLLGIPVIVLVGAYNYITGNQELGIILMVVSIFFPFFYAPNTWGAFLQGKTQYKKFAIFGIFQSLINALATATILLLNSRNALLIISVYLLSYSIYGIICYYKTLKYVQNKKSSGETIKYGWFLTKINFFNFIGESADKVIIGTLLSPVSLAIFSVISVLPFRMKMVIKSAVSISFPKMSQDDFSIVEFIKKKQGKIALATISFFSIIVGIVYYSTITLISEIFFGDKYLEYYFYGKYFVILVIFYTPLLIATWYLQAKKMSKPIAYVNVISFVIKIISLVIGVKIWGILGGIWIYNINVVLQLLMNIAAIYIEDNKLLRLSLKSSRISSN